MEIMIGGLAATTAGFITNPLEVLKTRMQLQGELKARGKHIVHYKNVFHAAYVVGKHDGIFALQKGLIPASWVQFIMNGMRFGFYDIIQKRGLLYNKYGRQSYYRVAFYSGVGGVIGQFLSSPFYLIKTHLQAQAIKDIAVGTQHEHDGMMSAFNKIYKSQGIKGLFRGATASVPRAFIASTSQLTSFSYSKDYLSQFEGLKNKKFLLTFVASMIGGTCISFAVTPFDLILIRLYNQPVDDNGKGKLYNGYLDCILKIYKTEGARAFYKGFGPIYFRLGPHSVFCLVFWDLYKNLYDTLLENKQTINK